MLSVILEQDPQEPSPEEQEALLQQQQEQQGGEEQPPPQEDPGQGQQQQMSPEEVQQQLMGQDPDIVVKTPGDIGKVHELKKVHQRLLAISHLLSTMSHPRYEKLHDDVNKALDLYKIIARNLDMFQNKFDIILIKFYKIIEKILDETEEAVKILKKEKEEERKKSKRAKKKEKRKKESKNV